MSSTRTSSSAHLPEVTTMFAWARRMNVCVRVCVCVCVCMCMRVCVWRQQNWSHRYDKMAAKSAGVTANCWMKCEYKTILTASGLFTGRRKEVRLDARTNEPGGRMDGHRRTSGRTYRHTVTARTGEQMGGRAAALDGQTGGQPEGWTDIRTSKKTDGRTTGLMDGWTSWTKDRRADGQPDGRTGERPRKNGFGVKLMNDGSTYQWNDGSTYKWNDGYRMNESIDDPA